MSTSLSLNCMKVATASISLMTQNCADAASFLNSSFVVSLLPCDHILDCVPKLISSSFLTFYIICDAIKFSFNETSQYFNKVYHSILVSSCYDQNSFSVSDNNVSSILRLVTWIFTMVPLNSSRILGSLDDNILLRSASVTFLSSTFCLIYPTTFLNRKLGTFLVPYILDFPAPWTCLSRAHHS